MNNIKIHITNLPQIQRAFKAAPYLMASSFRDAFMDIGEHIKARSMADTPVDTGRLLRSHYIKYNPFSALGFYLEVGTGIPENPRAYYDIYVHEGTRYMRGRPYLRNAVESENSFTHRRMTEALDKVLNGIARKV